MIELVPNPTFIIYRYEYVSGVVTVNEYYENNVQIYVANRGGFTETAHAVLLYAESAQVAHVDTREIGQGEVWRTEHIQEEGGGMSFWARIFTTSPDLVPSMKIFVGRPRQDSDFVSDVYVQPGDFAVFPLAQPLLPEALR